MVRVLDEDEHGRREGRGKHTMALFYHLPLDLCVRFGLAVGCPLVVFGGIILLGVVYIFSVHFGRRACTHIILDENSVSAVKRGNVSSPYSTVIECSCLCVDVEQVVSGSYRSGNDRG